MKNLLAIILSISLFSTSLFGQVVGFSKTKAIDLRATEGPQKLIKEENGTYYIKTGPKVGGIVGQKQWLRKASKHSSDKKKRLKSPFKHTEAFEFIEIDNKMHLLTLVENKESNKISREIIEFNNDWEIVDIKHISEYEKSKKSRITEQLLRISPDSNYIVIIDLVDLNLKNENYDLTITVLDKNLDIINTDSYRPKRKDSQRLTDLYNVVVNNLGTVFLLQKIYGDKANEAKKIDKRRVPNYYLELTEVPLDGNGFEYKLKNKNKFTYSAKVFLFEDQTPYIVTKTPWPSDKSGLTDGISVYVLNENEFIEHEKIFTAEEKSSYGIKYSKRNKADNFIVLEHYISEGNSSHFVISKQYVSSTTRLSGGNAGSFSTDHFYINEEFIIFSITRDGEITNQNYIPRFYGQSSICPPIIKKVGSSLYAIYLDRKKNLKTKLSDLERSPLKSSDKPSKKESAIVVAHITENKIQRDYINLDGSKECLNLNQSNVLHLDNKTLAFCLETGYNTFKNNRAQVVTLKFK